MSELKKTTNFLKRIRSLILPILIDHFIGIKHKLDKLFAFLQGDKKHQLNSKTQFYNSFSKISLLPIKMKTLTVDTAFL